MTTDFRNNRPKGFNHNEEKFLIPLINEMEKLIAETQSRYLFDTIKLDTEKRQVLSSLIIEFAEDLHNNIGLWASVEYYNKQLFNTPLPLFLNSDNETEQVFQVGRIQYFLHTLFCEFDPDLVIAPTHKDLRLLAISVSAFLSANFQAVRHTSTIKDFLLQPNDFGWDVKRKLIWVGTHSYLFRISFLRYIAEHHNGKMAVASTDDFICQNNTVWSGLGVIDIVAKTLDLPATTAKDVRSWYERYFSYYRVISSTDNTLTLENIVNDSQYRVRSDIEQSNVFKVGNVIFGGIVPYDDYWYWSGIQSDCGRLDKKAIDELRKGLIRKSSTIVYRYDKARLAKAQESVKIHHKEFVAYFGGELTTFKDGLSMAAALQKKDREKFESLLKHELEALMTKHGLKHPFPKMHLPDELINSENGVGLYFNSDEGTEIMLGFDHVLSGFEKEGKDLTDDECEAIRSFTTSEAISPRFVRTMIDRYGAKSINRSFLIDSELDVTDYLLHRYKGHSFRNRYPEITLIDE